MDKEQDYELGDWVRFFNSEGQLVIAQVELVRKEAQLNIVTTLGCIGRGAIIERRRRA